MSKVLVVDDEKVIVDILKFHLEKSGYETVAAYDGLEALNIAERAQPDLVLLDIMIPHMNGFEVCNKLRAKMDAPIIMLTAREDVTDKVLGLSLGADDYISKPFNVREVIARVDANLRRIRMDVNACQSASACAFEPSVHYGDFVVNKDRFEVRRDSRPLDLTAREYELLVYFIEHPHQVFSREELLRQVWHYEHFGDLRTVDVTISRLREKIGCGEHVSSHIMTKRGFGYYFI